ncbi:MAG: hypothetical protein R2811_02940 [Flavobacteriales bacterium]
MLRRLRALLSADHTEHHTCDTPSAAIRWVVDACVDHGLNTNDEVPDLPDQVESYGFQHR